MADEKFFMEVNKNTKLENSQTNWWLVGTIGHHVRQSLNKIVTFVRENFARFNNRYKSLFSQATTTTKTDNYKNPIIDYVTSNELSADKNDTSGLFSDMRLDKLFKENEEEITKLEFSIKNSLSSEKTKYLSHKISKHKRSSHKVLKMMHDEETIRNTQKNAQIGASWRWIELSAQQKNNHNNHVKFDTKIKVTGFDSLKRTLEFKDTDFSG